MYPFTDQLLGYRAAGSKEKASGLVLRVKATFCQKGRQILRQRGREQDYIEISIDSRVGLQHNDLYGYAPSTESHPY
jgi:hypothetical protein